ncbi:ead/Ea22-like family protein, partial [Pseudomonas sp. P2758]|uniref:ead/Ea22-like family protein n=1 Tax=Pseudomonas sp. P2758 TaxID=3409916 RepID=UPI003B5C011F
MSDYSELKRLAEKATPGPWWVDSHGMTMMSMEKLEVVFNHPAQGAAVRNEETGNLSHWRNDWDASYIATANPKTILALIAENETLTKIFADAPNLPDTDVEWLEKTRALEVERDQLRAEVAGL